MRRAPASACSLSRIWDARQRRLFLARDRLGIKPLYCVDNGGPVRCCVGDQGAAGSPRPSPRSTRLRCALPDLHRRASAADAVRGHAQACPGDDLWWAGDGPAEPRSYWDSAAQPDPARRTIEDWDADPRRLERSIERRMMSDVPVGVFLSGGVDSDDRGPDGGVHSRPDETFSIGYDDAAG